jgi:hypothetical protein
MTGSPIRGALAAAFLFAALCFLFALRVIAVPSRQVSIRRDYTARNRWGRSTLTPGRETLTNNIYPAQNAWQALSGGTEP